MYHWIVEEAARGLPVEESMRRLVDACEAAQPHPDWERFRRLPYADLRPVVEWLRRPFVEEPPVRPLRGLWFGLFNPIRGRETLADLYVAGSERFDPNPFRNDWAVNPEWWPWARYAHSDVLAEIYRVAYRRDGLENDAEYPLCLGYGVFAVRQTLELLNPALLLGASPSLGVAVGFDSGDWVVLGELTPQGLRPITG